MPVEFSALRVGAVYTRPQLGALWGYAGAAALARGVVTTAGTPYVVLFITREKQPTFTPYDDDLRDGVLTIDGETSHATEGRLVRAAEAGDEVHLVCQLPPVFA